MKEELPNTAKYNVIKIDDYINHDIKGEFYNCAIRENQFFRGTIDLIDQLDQFFDEILCQSEKRRFDQDKVIRDKRNHSNFHQQARRLAQGNFATLILRVQFRRHASWQGELTWIEENKKQYFRSVLELVVLIEEVMKKVEIERDG